MMKNPTAPPMCVPIAVAEPYVKCEYEIFSRCSLCCWKELFKITKERNKWKLFICETNTHYEFPANKTNENITNIVKSLGIKKSPPYRVKVYNNLNIVQDTYYLSLPKVINFITSNEIIIDEVLSPTNL